VWPSSTPLAGLPRVEREKKNKSKNCQISIFGFQWLAKSTQGWLKISTSCLVSSQIWVNHLPSDHGHFFDIFLQMIMVFGNNSESKNLWFQLLEGFKK
jgi:hypothetical protein